MFPCSRPATQVVPDAYLRQTPLPLHEPSVPQVATPWSVHWFSGSCPRERGARADRAGQRTRRAGARAGRRAADALRAEVVSAVARRRAGRPSASLPQLPVHAEVRRHAVRSSAVHVVRQVGVAVLHRYGSHCDGRHRAADAGAVAGALRRQRRSDALAAAHCVVVAQRRQAPVPLHMPSVPHVVAAVVAHGVAGVGAVPFATLSTCRGCRQSRTTCTCPCTPVAAVTLRAEAGVALVRHRAHRAGRLQRAGACVADVGRDAVRVGRAGGPARRTRRVALVRSDTTHRRRGADARAVAQRATA